MSTKQLVTIAGPDSWLCKTSSNHSLVIRSSEPRLDLILAFCSRNTAPELRLKLSLRDMIGESFAGKVIVCRQKSVVLLRDGCTIVL